VRGPADFAGEAQAKPFGNAEFELPIGVRATVSGRSPHEKTGETFTDLANASVARRAPAGSFGQTVSPGWFTL
jgi:hypothetical protein